jgi:uncharacterized repeat protein (TIGR01451 family)
MGIRWSIRSLSWSIALITTVSTGTLVAMQVGGGGAPPTASGDHRQTTEAALAGLPLSFIENRGQTDPRVGYYVQGADTSLYFTRQGMTLALEDEGEAWALQHRFVGARPTEPQAGDRLPGVVSYFKGSPEEWETGIPTYSSVAYRDLWPGIDLVYSGTGTALKYDLVLRPGADPSQVRMAYRGAREVRPTSDGGLEVFVPGRTFREARPYSYQEIGGRRVPVPTSFVMDEGDGSYGFRLGSYDPSRPLVIDPAVLLYAGYIGGNGDDEGRGVAVDGGGNAYVTGIAGSTEATFPVTGGPDTTHNVGFDAFVAKVDPAGTGLLYAGYIGGASDDGGLGVAVDGGGNAYVTGFTNSTEGTFPVTGGPDTTHNGGADAFVAKVDPTGTGLLYAGYIGGSTNEDGFGVAVDSGGNAYVTGWTHSSEATFPATVGPDTTFNGGPDAFVAKVDATGTGLLYAGYIGGAGSDQGFGVAVDGGGNAYVAGWTDSSQATFPVAVGPDATYNLNTDAFVANVGETAGVAADLALDKTDSPDPVGVKKVLTYTLTVTNGGPSEATGVTVEDELPPNVQFISATPSQGTCAQAGGVVTCDLGTMTSGGSATVTIKVRTTSRGTLTNSAEVSAAEADPDPANNADTETTTVDGGGKPPPPPCKFPPCRQAGGGQL